MDFNKEAESDQLDNPTEDGEKSGRVRSGKARMEMLDPDQRKELAQQAALARWSRASPVEIPENLPKATHMGELKMLDAALPCAVLDDGKRVFTQRGIFVALGRNKNPTTGHTNTIDRRPGFLSAANLNPFIPDDLRRSWEPVLFRLPKGSGGFKGNIAFGYDATILPKICHVFIDAKIAGKTTRQQEHIVTACRQLIKGLSGVAIIALVDEATGYQRDRADDALQAFLNQYLRSTLAVWVKSFPDEYYKEIYRLRNWVWQGMSKNRYSVVGKYTIDLVYRRLAPGLLKELEKKNPKIDGKRRYRYPQWLTEDIGNPALKQHLFALIALMRSSDSWQDFHDRADRAFPKYGDTLQLPFGPTPMELEAADNEHSVMLQ